MSNQARHCHALYTFNRTIAAPTSLNAWWCGFPLKKGIASQPNLFTPPLHAYTSYCPSPSPTSLKAWWWSRTSCCRAAASGVALMARVSSGPCQSAAWTAAAAVGDTPGDTPVTCECSGPSCCCCCWEGTWGELPSCKNSAGRKGSTCQHIGQRPSSMQAVCCFGDTRPGRGAGHADTAQLPLHRSGLHKPPGTLSAPQWYVAQDMQQLHAAGAAWPVGAGLTAATGLHLLLRPGGDEVHGDCWLYLIVQCVV